MYETVGSVEIESLIGGTPVAELRPEEPDEPAPEPTPTPAPVEQNGNAVPDGGELAGGDLAGEAGLSPA